MHKLVSHLRKILLILMIMPAAGMLLSGDEKPGDFTIGNITTAPGKMESGYLQVPGKEEQSTFIPVTVIHGAKKGKVLALAAGVHGYEYPPILALYRLKNMIDPSSLSGTLVLVHIANIPGFQKRLIYYTPYDWKNLNRVFPGDPSGTLAQRIAYVLTEEVVKKCDFLIDLHCGDGNEALIPYCYWMLSDNKELDRISREMVLAFGIKYNIIDKGRSKDISDSKYLANTAILHSKPAIITESGFLGGTDEKSITRNIDGILSVMRLFKMIAGNPVFVTEPVWIDQYEVIYSKWDGLFYPKTEMGYYVSKDEKVGFITDYLGNIIQELRAPFTGIILYIIHTPPIVKGEPIFEVGRIKQE